MPGMYETRRTLKRQLVEQRDRVMRMAMRCEADRARITSLNQAVGDLQAELEEAYGDMAGLDTQIECQAETIREQEEDLKKRIIENIDLHNQITALQMDFSVLQRNKELLEEWAALSRESNQRRGEALGKILSIIEQRTDLVAKPDDDTPIVMIGRNDLGDDPS